MNAGRFVALLTAANVVLVLVTLALVTQVRPIIGTEAPVLRVHALQIVDDQGRVRASLAIYPADPAHAVNGVVYPETVLLRLIDERGRPDVKLSANARGGVIVLGGAADPTYAQLGGDDTTSWLRLVDGAGREQVFRP